MADFTIITDSSCDVLPSILKEWGVKLVDLSFHKKDDELSIKNSDIQFVDFYNQMRSGTIFQTSAANTEDIIKVFEEELSNEKDVLYIAFSSGLSSTANAGFLAAEEMRNKYPERKISVVDSRSASAGQGLMVHLAVQSKNNGSSLDEVTEYTSSLVPKLCHWFTVDDLVYLKRGGRISAASAFAATALGIKPVLHMDDPGHLINMKKVRGRRQSIKELAMKYDELADDPYNGIYFISHGDCIDDALALEEILYEKYGHKAALITYIGAVIGSHSGPGTLALFFVGKHR